jgi:hypothetical protein
MPAVGVLNQALADEAEGEILFLGNIQGVNTNAFAAGDPVYVAVGGGYTNIRPAPPNISQYLGTVLRISSTSGSGQLLGTGVADPAISNLADTNITSPSDGDALVYKGLTQTWEPEPLPTAAGNSGEVQFKNGTAFAGDAGLTYNSTTKALTVGGATLTTNAPVLNLSQTWDASGTIFNGIRLNITDTASNANSLLMDLQTGGSSRLKISKSGNICGAAANNFGTVFINGTQSSFADAVVALGGPGAEGVTVRSVGFFAFSNTTNPSHANRDVVLNRDAADTLAQRRTTNAQTFRWYRTFTDASNYERGALQTAANQVIVAAETAGTGADDIDVTLTPAGTGLVRYGTHSAIGVETVTGFIEIKDAGGTIRKLAVVS